MTNALECVACAGSGRVAGRALACTCTGWRCRGQICGGPVDDEPCGECDGRGWVLCTSCGEVAACMTVDGWEVCEACALETAEPEVVR